MNIGSRIRSKRKELNLTLHDLADLSGLKTSNLSNIETGKRDIRTKTLEKIAGSLKCDPGDLCSKGINTLSELPGGLNDLIGDVKLIQLMSISEYELDWMKSIRFRADQSPSKQDFVDLLFIYRNI
ncbi:MAG: helix-turn-helix transcriptional regulator [bacterium]|nr:helix-turn-helix transcriptional regulator [bacterium]